MIDERLLQEERRVREGIIAELRATVATLGEDGILDDPDLRIGYQIGLKKAESIVRKGLTT